MRFVFGEPELDGARFELRRAGERVAVQPKVLRLLLHLAAHRDRVVSNSELLSELWPDKVVSSGSIKRAVKNARRALGERADSPTSLRNVRGQAGVGKSSALQRLAAHAQQRGAVGCSRR